MGEPFRCVVIDPPWPEYGGGGRGAQNHYGLMTYRDIRALVANLVGTGSPLLDQDVPLKVADDAHCWIWVTQNYLREGLGLMGALGFDYKRQFCWVKARPFRGQVPLDVKYPDANPKVIQVTVDPSDMMAGLQIGLGQYARGSHELCLFGSRGKAQVPPPENRPPDVLFDERTKHSKKPDACFAQWFEKVSPGPRLEIFARRPRDGWTVWGNEV